ncbi:mechanosensitive ion channel family protein [Kordiimonas aestuarii]|uniref:mechanosensitive ion channel family protein n=1 Tax=Kordiimonas aestuarii TaxID=1005925 RepID=UPI0021D2E3AD|nr:mechanosensitive ion channel domain-containing protein [Kordiimonas aestuarii]
MAKADSSIDGYIEQAATHSTNIQEWLLAYLQQPDTYTQFALIAGIVAIGLTIGRVAQKKIAEPIEDDRDNIRTVRKIAPRLAALIAPAISVILLIAAARVALRFMETTEVLETATRIATIWLMWTSIRSLVDSPFIRTIGMWILVPAALLHAFNELVQVIDALESASFEIGKVEITAYTVIKGIVFLSILSWLGKFLSQSGGEYIRRKESLTISTQELLVKLFDIALYVILFIVSLDLIGIDLTALTVFSGALGVGLGFGLQKIASNFISGIILLSERSVTLGNLVEMDSGTLGYMRKLGARASVIETFDGKEVMVPNEDFITSRVANLTHTSNNGRIDIPVGVSYNTDLSAAHDCILAAATDYDGASSDDDYMPQCFLRSFGDSSVDFLLTFWVDDVHKGRWRAQSDVMFAVWNNLKEAGIEIPFPQRDLHLKDAKIDFGDTSRSLAPAKEDEEDREVEKKDKAA